jgi:hypothetical protein
MLPTALHPGGAGDSAARRVARIQAQLHVGGDRLLYQVGFRIIVCTCPCSGYISLLTLHAGLRRIQAPSDSSRVTEVHGASGGPPRARNLYLTRFWG